MFTPVFGHSWAMFGHVGRMPGHAGPILGHLLDIVLFGGVQNKPVHAAPGTNCQMNKLFFCLLGGILVVFSSTLVYHVQPRCEKPYVETNSHLARRMRCLEFAPEIP